MKRIAIIVPYYGRFGGIMDFWLKSVSNNPTIDFIMFTDLCVKNKPKNLITINWTFNELVSYTQKNFDFEVNIPDPYKFIEFRPAYGEIFSEYLEEYDFWGYCDTDLIYGDIRKFVTEILLDKYDKLFGQGHFSLHRNNLEVNSTYKKCKEPSYKQIYTFPLNCAFDEYYGVSGYWVKYLPNKFYREIVFDDLDCNKYAFSPLFKKIMGKNLVYSYENGKLYRLYESSNRKICKEETMYVHFQKRSMKIETPVSDRFMMVPNSFIPYIDRIDADTLQYFDVSGKMYFHKYTLLFKRIINKLKKIQASFHPSVFGNPVLPHDACKYYQN